MLITFSGLDGSGKTTLIHELKRVLEKQNYRVTVLTMYYHLSFYALLRGVLGRVKNMIGIKDKHYQINSDGRSRVLTDQIFDLSNSKVSLRDPKIGMNDKKGIGSKIIYGVVRSVAAKRAALFFDLIILSIFRLYVECVKKKILITDRYLYDSLADVADLKSRRWWFIRLFLKIVPKPQLPVFVDVSPEEAYARKGEYPIEYMNWRRNTYLKIFGWLDRPVIIGNNDLETAQRTLEKVVMERLQ